MSHTSLANIERVTDDRTQAAIALAAQRVLGPVVAQGARPIRPMEEQTRGHDATPDLGFYVRADHLGQGCLEA